MITYVDKNNAGVYQARFEQATRVLRANNVLDDYSDDITTLEQYFLYLQELAEADPYYVMLPVDEATFDIDANTRRIHIPDAFARNGISIQGDEIAEIVYFCIDRFFDATDLSESTMNIAIQWETADKTAGVSKEFIRDINSRPGKLIFGWPLSSEITKKPGKIKFSVRFYKIGERTVTADNGQEAIQPYLAYNFNTLTAEATIGPSLDYDLHTKAKMETINRDSFILDRIVNSELSDPSIPQPGEPEWILNLAKSDDMKERIKDLEQQYYDVNDEGVVEPFWGYPMEAYAKGDGAISYSWRHAEIDEEGKVSSVEGFIPTGYVNNSYYVKAEPADTMDKSRIYYVAVHKYENIEDDNGTHIADFGIDYYAVQPHADIPIDEDGCIETAGGKTQLYERHSKAIATSTGVYHVVASNRRMGKHEDIDSYTIYIPMPNIPKILEEKSSATVSVMGLGGKEITLPALKVDEDDSVVHVLLDKKNSAILHVTAESPEIATAEENGWYEPKVALSYQWYKGDDDTILEDNDIGYEYHIEDATDAEHLIADGYEDYDQTYFVKVINTRNQVNAIKYSIPYRVTSAPKQPIIIAPAANIGNNQRYQPTGTTVTLQMDSAIPSDNYTYQWYKADISNEYHEDMELILEYEPENGDKKLEDEVSVAFTPSEPGYYYCIVTNHVNGSANSEYSIFFNFQDPV